MNLYSPNQRFCRRRSIRRALLSCAMARRCASDRLKIAPITRDADASDSAGSSSMRHRSSFYPPFSSPFFFLSKNIGFLEYRYTATRYFPCANESCAMCCRGRKETSASPLYLKLARRRNVRRAEERKRQKEREREKEGTTLYARLPVAD